MKSHISGLFCSANLVILFVTATTIVGELYKPLKTLLGSLTGHHWVSKGVLSVVLFFVVWFLTSKFSPPNQDYGRHSKHLIVTAIVCNLALFAFFIWHFVA